VYLPYINIACSFYLNLPISGLVGLFLLLIRIPNRVDRTNNASHLTIFGLAKKLVITTGFLIFAPPIVMLLMTLQYGGTEYPWNSAKSSGSSVDQALRYIDIFHNLGVLCGIQRYGPRLSCPPSSGLVQLHLCGLLHW